MKLKIYVEICVWFYIVWLNWTLWECICIFFSKPLNYHPIKHTHFVIHAALWFKVQPSDKKKHESGVKKNCSTLST